MRKFVVLLGWTYQSERLQRVIGLHGVPHKSITQTGQMSFLTIGVLVPKRDGAVGSESRNCGLWRCIKGAESRYFP